MRSENLINYLVFVCCQRWVRYSRWVVAQLDKIRNVRLER